MRIRNENTEIRNGITRGVRKDREPSSEKSGGPRTVVCTEMRTSRARGERKKL